jgi:hypothetical protein
MPHGHSIFAADDTNAALLATVADRVGAHTGGTPIDVLITSRVPDRPAHHLVYTGPLDEALDEWDRQVPPQTLAGALWVTADQDAAEAVTAWWLLRGETPLTPLSDLTDNNDRALRWSVVGARTVELPQSPAVAVDEAEVRSWLDAQPQVQELGTAIERIGGTDASGVLDSVQRFRAALNGLDELATLPPPPGTGDLDVAVAEHLRQVQRTGFGRWRGAKARAQSQADTVSAAKALAADRLREVIATRSEALAEQRRGEADSEALEQALAEVSAAARDVALPCAVDFRRTPRPWTEQAPEPRRYVLAHEQVTAPLADIPGVSVRTIPDLPADRAICMVVQSGFSLPALL